MSRETARRLFVLLLSVAVATGLMARIVQASAMDMTMVAMATDMPAHGKCDGCAGHEKALTPAACGVYCNSVIALAPTGIAFDPVAVGIVAPSAGAAAIGHIFPPDPYPPRPAGMN